MIALVIDYRTKPLTFWGDMSWEHLIESWPNWIRILLKEINYPDVFINLFEIVEAWETQYNGPVSDFLVLFFKILSSGWSSLQNQGIMILERCVGPGWNSIQSEGVEMLSVSVFISIINLYTKMKHLRQCFSLITKNWNSNETITKTMYTLF